MVKQMARFVGMALARLAYRAGSVVGKVSRWMDS